MGDPSSPSAKAEIEAALSKVMLLRGSAPDAIADAAWDLSTWAAAVAWDGSGNTREWLLGLRERIERVQALCPGRRGMTTEGHHALDDEEARRG